MLHVLDSSSKYDILLVQKTFVETAKNSQGNYHAILYNVPKGELKYIEENRGVEDYYLSEELGYSYLPNENISTGEEDEFFVLSSIYLLIDTANLSKLVSAIIFHLLQLGW